ncbi:MAG: alpha-E domain-containing protein [Caldilineaceae bacterium]
MSTMLSRVADSLYWMSRYLERAEHTARLVDVALDLMPDRSEIDNERAWRRTYEGLQRPFPEHDFLDAYQMTQELTFGGTNSISAYITTARDDARHIREHMSSEMWLETNSLYLGAKEMTMKKLWRDQPHDFFNRIKQGTHLFYGIADSTMYHGEGWYFIQVGLYMERASNVAALLKAYLQDATDYRREATTSHEYVDWVSLLRSCTAFEAYCKVYTAETRLDSIAEFLLLNAEFPHSVHFAVNKMQEALIAISSATNTSEGAPINRQIGRLKSTLDYDGIDDVFAHDLGDYLSTIQSQCMQIHESIYSTYVDYSADERLAA